MIIDDFRKMYLWEPSPRQVMQRGFDRWVSGLRPIETVPEDTSPPKNGNEPPIAQRKDTDGQVSIRPTTNLDDGRPMDQ